MGTRRTGAGRGRMQRPRRADRTLHPAGLRTRAAGARRARDDGHLARAGPRSQPGADGVSHPQDLSLREQAAGVAGGEIDAGELLGATLDRIEERNAPLNAIVATFPEESERMLAEAPEGPLHGVPIAVKDQFALPRPAPRDGTAREIAPASDSGVHRRLREAGAVIVAVANMHYLGGGSTGALSAYG